MIFACIFLKKNYMRFIETLINNNFNLPKALENDGLSFVDFYKMVSNPDFIEELNKTLTYRKILVELAMFNKCIEKGDATTIKEFLRIAKQEENNQTTDSFFVEVPRFINAQDYE